MKFFRATKFLALFFAITFLVTARNVFSQDTGTGSTTDAGKDDTEYFILLPVLEAVFSSQVVWNPLWSESIPLDGFLVSQNGGQPSLIELSNGDIDLVLRRDSEGRLLEFPYFYKNGYADVQTAYNDAGAVQTMTITLKSFTSQNGNGQSDSAGQSTNTGQSNSTGQSTSTGQSSGNGQSSNTGQSDSTGLSNGDGKSDIINITFPDNFVPYSEFSPGGSFPPLTVSYKDSDFYVFIFESQRFLSETWYDSKGNMLVYCVASTEVENGSWRIRTMSFRYAKGMINYYFVYSPYGNIAETSQENWDYSDNNTLEKKDETVLSALYTDGLPVNWQFSNYNVNFQWDAQRKLTVEKISGTDNGLIIEYRYDYETDDFGNWIKRDEAAYMIQNNLLVPQPLYSRDAWNRQISY